MNGSEDEPLQCVLVRNDQDPIVVNLDIPSVDLPEEIIWIDPHHPHS